MKPFAAFALLVLLASNPVRAGAPGTVNVLYAGSLVTQMEGPIKSALRAEGIHFQGEPGGSKALEHLINSGIKSPDVFISVDPVFVRDLGSKVAGAVTFAGTSLGIGWSDKSRYASLFDRVAAGKIPLARALSTPGLQIGRTDPLLDPKGGYTVEAVKTLLGKSAERRVLGNAENAAQVFPEEDLLTRIDVGEADVGFFYRTEAVARGLHFIPLPGKASFSDKITYTLAVMKSPPHPAQAKAFEDFMLRGAGKTILEKAGVRYFTRPRPVVPQGRSAKSG